MPGGTGLLKFQKQYPERTFDVGIAEEHAVSMAGGLAKQGMTPVVALYSTFLQRGFDQIMQDIGLLRLHVILAVDRAGLVGDDGPTHHGVFDIGFLRQVPGMQILAPASMLEQQEMLCWAAEHYDGPVAIRYPRGMEGSYSGSDWHGLDGELVKCHRQGKDMTFITYGSLLSNVLEAAEILSQQGCEVTVLRLMSLGKLGSEEVLSKLSGDRVMILEETAAHSGIRESLAWELRQKNNGLTIWGRDLGEEFVPHGSKEELYRHCGLDAQSIAAFVKEALSHEN